MKNGGNYTASRAEDGTWTLHDVPVFSEVPKGARGNDEAIGEKWLRAAVVNAAKRAASGYLAPAHINHHDKTTRRAGFFLPTDVRKFKYDGKEIWTLFADISGIPDEIYRLIRAKELPYRSVEIIKYEQREIGSLALMADEVPFFRYPITTVGAELAAEPSITVQLESAQTPALAYRSTAGQRSAFLFRFEGRYMADDEKDKKKGPPVAEKDGGDEKAEGVAKEGGDEKEEKLGEAAPAPGAEASEILKSMQGVFMSIDAKLTALLAISGGSAQGTGGVAATPVQQMKAKVDEAKKEAEAMDPKADGRFTALESEIASMKKAKQVETLTAWAFRELDGVNLTDEAKKKIEKYAAAGKESIEEHVATIKQFAVVDPPHYGPGVGVTFAAAETGPLPEQVVKAQAQGAVEGEKAMKMFRAFEVHNRQPGVTRLTFERFSKAEELRQQALSPSGLPIYAGRV